MRASQSFRFRESRRLPRAAPVRLSTPGEDGELVARTRDIAVGGMFVATADLRPVGAGTTFVLELGSADAPDTVRGEATVVWVRETSGGADQPAGMGMRFTRLEAPGEERLAMLFSEPPDEVAGAAALPPAPAEPEESLPDEVETVDSASDRTGAEVGEPEAAAVGDATVTDDVEPPLPVDPAQAAEETPSDRAATSEEPTTGDGAVGGASAELFGDLADDRDDWVRRESDRPSWVWPTVAAVVLVGVLLIFLGGPLTRLVGIGGNGAEEQPESEARNLEPPASGQEPAGPADPPPASRPSIESGPDPVVGELPAPAASARPSGPTTTASEPATSTSSEPTVRPRTPAPRPAPAAPPANATAIRAISAAARDGRTVVEITGNAAFKRHHEMLLEVPPRLLVRLIGVRRSYDASAVSAPRLRGVRTGVHGRGATRNLHVVLDLAAPDIVATVERSGDRVVVSLSD